MSESPNSRTLQCATLIFGSRFPGREDDGGNNWYLGCQLFDVINDYDNRQAFKLCTLQSFVPVVPFFFFPFPFTSLPVCRRWMRHSGNHGPPENH